MTDNHIIVAGYSAGGYTKTRPAYQYDYGQQLQLQDFPELPATFEMHFSVGMGQAITRIGTDGLVAVPNVCLERYGTTTAWLFLHDAVTDGETRYVIEIPVRSRALALDQDPTPEEQSAITEAIAALNAGVTAAEAAQAGAEAAAESVGEAAEQASEKAGEAAASATAAAGSAEAAAGSATSAAGAATSAGESASAASGSATAAAGSAEAAAGSAGAAAGSAESAAASRAAAEAARDAAQAAAGDFQGITATASGLAAGSNPSIDVTHSEGGLYQFAFGIPKGDKGDQGDPAPASQVQPAVDSWLGTHITNPSSPPLDRSLSLSSAAAPADMVGDVFSAVNRVEEKIPDGMAFPFAVVDSNGKAAIIVDDDGNTSIKQKHFEQDEKGFHNKNENGDIVTDYKTSDIYDYVVCDQNNHILFYVKDGKLVVHSIETNNIDSPDVDAIEKNKKRIATSKQANFDSEINMFIAYGQSWSVGYDAAAITLASKYDNIMFNTGIKNNPLTDTETEPTSFVPMVEYTGTSNGVGTQTCGETPVSAMCNMIKQLIEEENGYVYTDFPYQMLGNAPGMGDKTLAELKKGTTWYNRLISQVEDAFTIASGLGKKLVVQAFSWQQLALGSGISTTYAEALEQLRSDIDEDVKAITGQTQDVKCITWQTFNRSATGAADCYAKYVGASETYPNIICSGASYQFKHVASDNLHLLAPDNDWAGAYFGVAYKRTIIDGEKFVPLKPIRAEIDGKDCILTFNVPQKPLVFDTDTVAPITNKGFTLLNSGGTEKTISSVDIIAPDKIRIRASENIANTDRIAYGQNAGTAFGPVNGNRGNVRDSQGDYITYIAGNGEKFKIHNWLVIFDKTISTMTGV